MIQPGVQRDRSHPWARIQDDSLRQSTYTGKEFATEFQQAKVLKKLLKNIEKLLKNTEIMP